MYVNWFDIQSMLNYMHDLSNDDVICTFFGHVEYKESAVASQMNDTISIRPQPIKRAMLSKVDSDKSTWLFAIVVFSLFGCEVGLDQCVAMGVDLNLHMLTQWTEHLVEIRMRNLTILQDGDGKDFNLYIEFMQLMYTHVNFDVSSLHTSTIFSLLLNLVKHEQVMDAFSPLRELLMHELYKRKQKV